MKCEAIWSDGGRVTICGARMNLTTVTESGQRFLAFVCPDCYNRVVLDWIREVRIVDLLGSGNGKRRR